MKKKKAGTCIMYVYQENNEIKNLQYKIKKKNNESYDIDIVRHEKANIKKSKCKTKKKERERETYFTDNEDNHLEGKKRKRQSF